MDRNLYLSKTSVKMINIISDTMRKYNIVFADVYTFLYGLIKYREENHAPGVLLEYLISNGNVSSIEVEEMLEFAIKSVSSTIAANTAKVEASSEEVNKPEENPTSSAFKEESTEEFNEELESDKIQDLITEEHFAILFKDIANKEYLLPVDNELRDVLITLSQISSIYSIEEIEPIHFTMAFFLTESPTFKDFIEEELRMDFFEGTSYFDPDTILKKGAIPFELSGFLSLRNEKVDPKKPCEILMRDKETNILWNIMLKMNKKNAVIVGEPGVGKTALIEKITYDIIKGTCPPEFKDFRVIQLDVNSLIAGTSYRGQSEMRIKKLIEFLEENRNIILFIDEIHTILGAGAISEGGLDFSNALKPILSRGDTIVIGATTSLEYERYFSRDAALKRRFERVEVEEPSPEDVYPMIKNKIKALSVFHGVKISETMVKFAIMIAGAFAFDKKNPDKTLDLIDRAMVSAKRTSKKTVDKSSILENFAIFFKMWDEMDENSKKEIAYHESGHYIMIKVSDKLIEYELQAISIMPAEDYLGVTVFNINNNKIPFRDLSYFIDVLALDLAGRVAESFFRKTFTSGASEDLNHATRSAFTIVTRLGLASDSIKNRIYLNSEDYPMFSEKSTDFINEEINHLIEKAYNRATEVIEENKDILEALVKELLKRQIMSEFELDRVWQRVLKRREKKKNKN